MKHQIQARASRVNRSRVELEYAQSAEFAVGESVICEILPSVDQDLPVAPWVVGTVLKGTRGRLELKLTGGLFSTLAA